MSFRVQAEDPDGISLVELYIYEYGLSEEDGVQVANARKGGHWGLAEKWTYTSGPVSIANSHEHSGFPAESYVRFLFRVTDTGGSRRSEEWLFAAGDWPFGDRPIPILGNGPPGKRIDVCFVADQRNYDDGASMLGDLEALIFDGYHRNNAIAGPNRQHWQFYYSPTTGSISDYQLSTGPPFLPPAMTIPASVGDSAIIDHSAVIHTDEFQDWADANGNFGGEPYNIGTVAHETGHSAFGLGDEYSLYPAQSSTSTDPHHNVYASRSEAETYNASNGWPPGDAEQIQEGRWRPEPKSLDCIMREDGDDEMPDFARTCYARAMWFYSQLSL